MKHKDHYNDEYIKELSQKLFDTIPNFDQNTFSQSLIGRLNNKELFARFDCIVNAMIENMPSDYSKNIQAFFWYAWLRVRIGRGNVYLWMVAMAYR